MSVKILRGNYIMTNQVKDQYWDGTWLSAIWLLIHADLEFQFQVLEILFLVCRPIRFFHNKNHRYCLISILIWTNRVSTVDVCYNYIYSHIIPESAELLAEVLYLSEYLYMSFLASLRFTKYGESSINVWKSCLRSIRYFSLSVCSKGRGCCSRG